MLFEGLSNEHLVAELIQVHGHVFRRGWREAENLFVQLGLVYYCPDSSPEFREYYTNETTKLMPPDTARRVLERESKRPEPPSAIKVPSRQRQMNKRTQPWWKVLRIW